MQASLAHKPAARKAAVDRSTLRILLTILMYVGVILFLYPYATSRISSGVFFLICGAFITLTCGALRCYLTDGDCPDRHHQHHHPNL